MKIRKSLRILLIWISILTMLLSASAKPKFGSYFRKNRHAQEGSIDSQHIDKLSAETEKISLSDTDSENFEREAAKRTMELPPELRNQIFGHIDTKIRRRMIEPWQEYLRKEDIDNLMGPNRDRKSVIWRDFEELLRDYRNFEEWHLDGIAHPSSYIPPTLFDESPLMGNWFRYAAVEKYQKDHADTHVFYRDYAMAGGEKVYWLKNGAKLRLYVPDELKSMIEYSGPWHIPRPKAGRVAK